MDATGGNFYGQESNYRTGGFDRLLSIFFGVFAKVFRDRFAKVKTAKATVTGKHTLDTARKVYGTYRPVSYVVSFNAEGKRRVFRVSELTFHDLKAGETGILKYKGSKFVDFQKKTT